MDDTRTTRTQRLSEVEAHQLLARAAELDARFGASVTTEQLLAAALEAGISAEAIAQASSELAAGKLGSPARSAALAASIATGGRVVLAGVLTWWLIADAGRPLAQGLALISAMYGAYKALSWLTRGFNQRLTALKAAKQKPEVALKLADRKDDLTSLSRRLFVVPATCRTA